MKKNRAGKAAIFKDIDIKKIRKSFTVPRHRAIFEVALYTGERMGAVVQLKVSDVYRAPGLLQGMITYQSRTRKARPDGTRETRQVYICRDLANFLRFYQPPKDSEWLFPGRPRDRHICYDSVYQYWANKFLQLGLDHRGFSTHSTRRWLINSLVRQGVHPKIIQNITGHKNINVVMGYADADPDVVKNALNGLGSIAA